MSDKKKQDKGVSRLGKLKKSYFKNKNKILKNT